ncbi:quinone-dependent dihydroorotate dehydrogenase [Paenibacillus sp. y28]|uniref:quinone-dependent dihydroorotate dehydrogenase n=1 Tax=Paenibacillus sp. y28 TaxID=3129110 RepID=UPI003015B1B3
MYQQLLKPILFQMDPEKAHHLTVDGMATAAEIPGFLPLLKSMYGVQRNPALELTLCGLNFPSPIGLAAGLDKNGVAVKGFAAIGFGFMEVGTVTPLPQSGNEQPRLFRLPEDEALINRMGFNNVGTEAMKSNLRRNGRVPIPVAVNIGKNKVTPNEEAEEDYRKCVRALYQEGDFFVINISSPNTPGLRNLQHGEELRSLLAAVKQEMAQQAVKIGGADKPVFVKIAPDLSTEELEYIMETIVNSGVSGVIATNTTLDREGLNHPNRTEAGGLSGRPLTEKSTEVIRRIYAQTGGRLPIIGVGGIFTAEDAYAKIRAGASLIEVYTALIYSGPGLVREIQNGLAAKLKQDGFTHITQAIGADHR